MRRKEINKKIKFAFLFTFLTLPLYANVPIGGAIVMALPTAFLGLSFGFSLVAVTLIEMLVIKRKLDLKYQQSLKLSFFANFFSTLIGVGIAAAYSSILAFLVLWIPGSFLLFLWFTYLSTKTGFLMKFSKKKALCFLPFLVIGVLGLIFGAILTPGIKQDLYPLFLQLIAFVILLVIGFVITFITEGYIVARYYSEKPDKIISAVFFMNLISYIILLPIFALAFVSLFL